MKERTEGKELSFPVFLEMPSCISLQQGWHRHKSSNGHISNFRTLYISVSLSKSGYLCEFIILWFKINASQLVKSKSALCYAWSITDLILQGRGWSQLTPGTQVFFYMAGWQGSGQLQRGQNIYLTRLSRHLFYPRHAWLAALSLCLWSLMGFAWKSNLLCCSVLWIGFGIKAWLQIFF